ncbi:MAG: ATP:cob(I)alamin adenosyltransferase, partial [Deltaproteobacteria bacterium]
MVILNRIYTRTGDAGETALGNGQRVKKFATRVEAYGTVDELNATLGLARLHSAGELDALMALIQNDLFDLGADLCRPPEPAEAKAEYPPLRIVDEQVARLEKEMDKM